MSRFVFSPRAKNDIDKIWADSVAGWGTSQAEKYIREMKRVIEFSAADPDRGLSCDEIRAGYRKCRAGSHIIFFRPHPSGIEIVRILHGHMDFSRHL